jgi:hypothetical protein
VRTLGPGSLGFHEASPGCDKQALRTVAAARLLTLAPRVAMLSAVTPENFVSECARLATAFRRGSNEVPRFVYPERDSLDSVFAELASLAELLFAAGDEALASRAHELALEARLVDARCTPAFRALAARRFGVSPHADELAERFAAPLPEDGDASHVTDDKIDPESLLAVVRAEVGRLFLPVRVTTSARLASLAAAAGTTIVVAEGRRTTAREALRTALHEVHGHVVPALARARVGGLAELRLAGDVDREEGRALLLEEAAGYLDAGRKADLGIRHLAARWAHEGAELVEVVRGLLSYELSPERAVMVAARACRAGGLGRERVYLPAYFRARAERAERALLGAIVAE